MKSQDELTQMQKQFQQNLILKYSRVICVVFVLYAILYYVRYQLMEIPLISLVAGVGCFLTWVVHRWTNSIQISMLYLTLVSISAVVLLSIYSGGVKSPALFWLTVIPIFGTFMSREQWAAPRWLAFSFVGCFAVYLHDRMFGVARNLFYEVPSDVIQYFALLGVGCLNALIAHQFMRELSHERMTTEKKTLELEEALTKLRQARQQLLNFSSQVAHDIRSPLAALNVISQNLSELPEEKRVFLKMAIGRINDIANVNAYKKFETLPTDEEEQESPIPSESSRTILSLVDLVDKVVSEKRVEYRPKIGIQIQLVLSDLSYGIFCRFDEAGLSRVLSNLINNAVEAIAGDGKVTVEISLQSKNGVISISDTGKGIDDSKIKHLGKRGATFGKEGGSGLGLFHAQSLIHELGGTLEIKSKLNVGTAITLSLPTVVPPVWYLHEICLTGVKWVVVVDDDTSIHQIWDQRIGHALTIGTQLQMVHLSSPRQLIVWVAEDLDRASQAVYLVDYEFRGHEENGIDTILECRKLTQMDSPSARTILVTSRADEKHVIAQCEKQRIYLVPKSLAGLVPIGSEGREL